MLVIFDFDQTLFDTSPVEPYRVSKQWKKVESMLDSIRPYEGVIELIKALRMKGVKVAVVTNSPRQNYCEKILEHWDIQVDDILGYFDTPKRKPDPFPIQQIIQRYSISPINTHIVGVGDSMIDITAYNDAGIISVKANWGLSNGEELANPSANFSFESVNEFSRFVLGLENENPMLLYSNVKNLGYLPNSFYISTVSRELNSTLIDYLSKFQKCAEIIRDDIANVTYEANDLFHDVGTDTPIESYFEYFNYCDALLKTLNIVTNVQNLNENKAVLELIFKENNEALENINGILNAYEMTESFVIQARDLLSARKLIDFLLEFTSIINALSSNYVDKKRLTSILEMKRYEFNLLESSHCHLDKSYIKQFKWVKDIFHNPERFRRLRNNETRENLKKRVAKQFI
jgi:HAD superfamily hydrolase (TIGR01662 family)